MNQLLDNMKLAQVIFPNITKTIDDLEKQYPLRDLPEGAFVTRFAPSPTGFLHTGSLFSALIGRKMAQQTNGVFFIRLEDTDQKRFIEGSGESLVKELEKFGVIPDEGYFGTYEKGNYGPYCQSDRAEIYKIVIKEMIIKGLVYPCFCSPEKLDIMRKEQEAKKSNFGYFGEYAICRNVTALEAIKRINNGEPYVLRFKSSGDYHNKIKVHDEIRGDLEIAENDQDIVVLKSDGLPTYHFAHLVDDHFMRTTCITRGEEWLASLPIHVELFDAMNWPRPKYAHLPVIMKLDDGKKRKLSKRKDDEAAVSYFLEQGYPVDGFIEYLLTIANSNYEEWRRNNMNLDKYDFQMTFDKMTLDGALFDLAKIKNICKERLAHLTKEEFMDKSLDWAKNYSKELYEVITRDPDYYKSIINIEREKDNPRKDYEKYSDVLSIIDFFYDDYYEKLQNMPLPFNENITREDIVLVLKTYLLNMGLDLTEDEWFENLKNVASQCGFCPNVKEYKKNKEAYKGHVGDVSEIIRIAISTRKNTPNLYYVLKILGTDKVKQRINNTINSI